MSAISLFSGQLAFSAAVEFDLQLLLGPSEAPLFPSKQEEMDKAALESGRLSPVYKRDENDSPNKMEGLNPERARRLLAPRSPSMPLNHTSIGPRNTGSNNIALGKPGAQSFASIEQQCSTSPNKKPRPPLVRIPKLAPPVIAGTKRPRDQLEEPQEPHLRRQWPLSPPVLPPRKLMLTIASILI
jgi:hypothetical protein